jgi:hypothetical protein
VLLARLQERANRSRSVLALFPCSLVTAGIDPEQKYRMNRVLQCCYLTEQLAPSGLLVNIVTWPQLAWHGKALSFISRVLLQLTFDERRAMRAACHSADDRDFKSDVNTRELLGSGSVTGQGLVGYLLREST